MYADNNFSIKKLDVFQSTKGKYLQSTYIGALLSLITIIFSIYLIKIEISNYKTPIKESKIEIDYSHKSENLQINFDILIKFIPCSLISIDSQNIISETSNDQKINYDRIDNKFNIIEKNYKKLNETDQDNSPVNNKIYEDTLKDLNQGNGCHVYGYFNVLKVPGIIIFSVNNYDKTLSKLMSDEKYSNYKFDFSHKINKFIFGKTRYYKFIEKNIRKINYKPLHGIEFSDDKSFNVLGYFINLVPTDININGKHKEIFQYTFNKHRTPIEGYNDYPSIIFQYNVSPIKMINRLESKNLFNTIINLSAILGGMYSIINILNILLIRYLKLI